MNFSELQKKDVQSLMAELEIARKEKLANRMSLKMRQAKDSHVMKRNARMIAQIEMLLRREQSERPAKDQSQSKK
jgi:ribosomal protein L29